jgi:hypothetical protein
MTQADLAPLTFDLRPDLRVLALTAGAVILTGILFGVAPRGVNAFVIMRIAWCKSWIKPVGAPSISQNPSE